MIPQLGHELALRLFLQLYSGENNLVFSPYSIMAALMRILPGAKGETADEIRHVLKIGQTPTAEILNTIRKLESNLVIGVENLPHCQLRLANRLLVDQRKKLEQPFLELIHMSGAHVDPSDFSHPNEIIAEVNQWIEKFTNGKIKDLLSPGSVNDRTLILLVNAIYLNLKWRKQFEARNTRPEAFFSPGQHGTEKFDVLMMRQTASFNFIDSTFTDCCQILEMPYLHQDLSMLIFLPDRDYPLSKWIQQYLRVDNIGSWLQAMSPHKVRIHLPKFNIHGQSFSLSSTLKALGMPKAFIPAEADFTDMHIPQPPNEGVFISDVLHEATIDVDEAGTEAAAATAIIAEMFASSGREQDPIIFKVDRPFVFMIRENTTGMPLFFGQVTNPTRA